MCVPSRSGEYTDRGGEYTDSRGGEYTDRGGEYTEYNVLFVNKDAKDN